MVSNQLANVLSQLKIKADIIKVENEKFIDRYFLKLHSGTKVSKIENCTTEIALGIKSYGKPIVKTITEDGMVVIEAIVNKIEKICFSDLEGDLLASEYNLPLAIGRGHDGKNLIVDMTRMPHLLVSGATGSGKSVMLHCILNSLMLNDNVQLAMIDPKMVEFSYYGKIKQLFGKVANSMEDSGELLECIIEEMEDRFKKMSKAGVNSIVDYNKINEMKYIVLVIDEFSDLMDYDKKKFQSDICCIAHKARACGIHVVIATQRPSVDVVTGLIKANFPARISGRVYSSQDSRVVFGCNGAEKLLGNGDAIIHSSDFDMLRFQGAYISVEEIEKNCNKNKISFFRRMIDRYIV